MATIWQSFKRLFSDQPAAITPGIYHYQSPPDDPRNYRLHLRIEPDGLGLLIVNASTVLHLNETAAEYAFYLVHNTPADEVVERMAKRYHVTPEIISQDYENLSTRIITLVETPDLDPVTFMDFNRRLPYSSTLSAPYRLDIALTYQLPSGADPTQAPETRVTRELSAEEWKTVLFKAWNAGVPHVIFTGGEPTLRADLPELIAHAEFLGQVTGLFTDGQKLANQGYLDILLRTGLDHIMILLNPADPGDWQAINNCLAGDIFTAVHLTITQENLVAAPDLLKQLADLGVPAISLTAATPELKDDLDGLRSKAAALGLSLVWDLPVPYSAHNPVAWETSGVQLLQPGAGRAWLYIEPDGDVLSTQGGIKLGNIISDNWENIYNR